MSAHERLGGRRDRSPPHGGAGGSGSSRHQAPPAARQWQSGPFNQGVRHGGAHHGTSGDHGGWTTGTTHVWKEKTCMRKDQNKSSTSLVLREADVSFPFRESLATYRWATDPMKDEAGWGSVPVQITPARWSHLRPMVGWFCRARWPVTRGLLGSVTLRRMRWGSRCR